MMLTMLVVWITVIAGLLIGINWILRLGAEFVLNLFLQGNARGMQARRGPQADGRDAAQGSPATVAAGLEVSELRDLLDHHDGNVSAAAKAAGIDWKTFERLMKKYQLR